MTRIELQGIHAEDICKSAKELGNYEVPKTKIKYDVNGGKIKFPIDLSKKNSCK